MSFYRRKLPHWDPDGAVIFITWRLYGSLPSRAGLRPANSRESAGHRFVETDRLLDNAMGPHWLKLPDVAGAVLEVIHVAERDWKLYDLFAWVVMSNHVHVLVRPHKPLREVTRAIKSASARDANRSLGREGQPFWQVESFDQWVRSYAEFEKIVRYIEDNPVKAGLVQRPEDWKWSSAAAPFRTAEMAGRRPAAT